MGRAPRGLRTVLLAAFSLALHLDAFDSVMSKTKIPPPSNLDATLENLFVVTWTWDPPENLTSHAACQLKYESVVNHVTNQRPQNIRKVAPHNLNNEICFEVKAICVDVGQSDWKKHCSYFMKGYPETSITEFKCTWDDGKEMECTWDYQKSTPPETNYILYYMFKEKNEIHECKEYIRKAGVVHGCKFKMSYTSDRIHILVTDNSLKLGRFYTSLEPMDILRPLPPNITVTKLSIDRIQVNWSDSKSDVKDYEVQSKDSKSQNWTISRIHGKNNFIIDSARRDAMYTVRVRAKFDQNFGGVLWSNWSTERSVGEHREDDWTVHYILLITIPLIAAIATILLLVFLKRLKILICPPIPDPGKMFRDLIGGPGEEFQHWIKSSSMISPNKLVQEETCSVILVEKETSPEMPPC